jgi:hypothetical protein
MNWAIVEWSLARVPRLELRYLPDTQQECYLSTAKLGVEFNFYRSFSLLISMFPTNHVLSWRWLSSELLRRVSWRLFDMLATTYKTAWRHKPEEYDSYVNRGANIKYDIHLTHVSLYGLCYGGFV